MTSVIFPSNWEKVELSDVALFQNGYAFKSTAYSDVGDFVIRIGNVQDRGINLNNPAYVNAKKLNAEKFRLSKGDILISLTGNVGRVAIIKQEHLPAVLNQRVAKVNFSSLMPSKFNYYLLRSNVVQSELLKCAKGAAQLNVSTKDMDRLIVGIPSIAEQKIIAEKLDTLLAQIDSTKARLEQIPKILKRFRQAVLSHFLISDLQEPKIKLVELTSKIGSGSTPKGGNDNYKMDGIPFVRSLNIHTHFIKHEDLAYIDKEQAKKLNNVIIHEKDVLLNITGASIGRVNIAPDNFVGGRVNQHVAIIRCQQSKILPEYLHVYMASPHIQKWIQGENYGATRQALTKKMLEELPIIVPSVKKQHEIVRRIEQLFAYADTIEKQVNSALSRVNNLTQSILAKAFRGELTAQWRAENPELISGENSAAALLEKIKTQRAASTGRKASRKKS